MQPNPFALVTHIAASAILIYSLFPQFGGPALWFVTRIVLMPSLVLSGFYLGIVAEDRKYEIRPDVRWVFAKLPFASIVFIAIILVGLQVNPPVYRGDVHQAGAADATTRVGAYVLPIVLLIISVSTFWVYRATAKSKNKRPASEKPGQRTPAEIDLKRTDLEFQLAALDADLVRKYNDPKGKRVLERRKMAILKELEELQ